MGEIGRQVGDIINRNGDEGRLVPAAHSAEEAIEPPAIAAIAIRSSGVDYVGPAAESGTEPHTVPKANAWMASLPA